MGYTNLLVHVDLGHGNAELLGLAGHLAERLGASVTGIAVRQPMRIIYSESYVPDSLIEQDRADIEAEIAVAEKEFRAALTSVAAGIAWRSAITFEPLSALIAQEARSADLVVTGLDKENSVFDPSRHVDVGDLVMQAGRPCLIVPDAVSKLGPDHAIVGWKDTTETRRAVQAALPMLAVAGRVTVVELAPEDERERANTAVRDVVAWLARHDIKAEAVVEPLSDDASQLDWFMADRGADLIVAGAYGHSRVREWALGGVTRNLLLRGSRCALVSH